MDYFLPKRATNNLSFLNSISKVIINDEFRSDSIVRKDYKSKSLIYLIEDLKFNDNLNWIKYEMFEKYINIILNKENNNINQEEIKNLFNKLYDIKETSNDIALNKNENDIMENNLSDSLNEDNEDEEKNSSIIDEVYESKNIMNIDNFQNDDININYEDSNYIMSINDKENDNIIEILELLNINKDNLDTNNKEIKNYENNKNLFEIPLNKRVSMLKNKEDVKPKKRRVMYPKDEFPSDYGNSSDEII